MASYSEPGYPAQDIYHFGDSDHVIPVNIRTGELLGSYTMSQGSGTETRWHESGKKASEGAYKEGKKHGTWRQWGEDGAEGEVEEYVDGELQSTPTDASDEQK